MFPLSSPTSFVPLRLTTSHHHNTLATTSFSLHFNILFSKLLSFSMSLLFFCFHSFHIYFFFLFLIQFYRISLSTSTVTSHFTTSVIIIAHFFSFPSFALHSFHILVFLFLIQFYLISPSTMLSHPFFPSPFSLHSFHIYFSFFSFFNC